MRNKPLIGLLTKTGQSPIKYSQFGGYRIPFSWFGNIFGKGREEQKRTTKARERSYKSRK